MQRKAAVTAFGMFLFLALATVVTARPDPAKVAGTWTISVSEGSQAAEQTIDLKQDGGKITGTFKGPRQQGNSGRHSRWQQHQISREYSRSV
jgi:hypothetical protein